MCTGCDLFKNVLASITVPSFQCHWSHISYAYYFHCNFATFCNSGLFQCMAMLMQVNNLILNKCFCDLMLLLIEETWKLFKKGYLKGETIDEHSLVKLYNFKRKYRHYEIHRFSNRKKIRRFQRDVKEVYSWKNTTFKNTDQAQPWRAKPRTSLTSQAVRNRTNNVEFLIISRKSTVPEQKMKRQGMWIRIHQGNKKPRSGRK